jgi:hypothetical protein
MCWTPKMTQRPLIMQRVQNEVIEVPKTNDIWWQLVSKYLYCICSNIHNFHINGVVVELVNLKVIYFIVLYFCLVFLRIVYPMLPVSLDCSCVIASSVFSNVYLYNSLHFRHHNNFTMQSKVKYTCWNNHTWTIQRNWQHRVHNTKKNQTKV